jgi:hypothetical protein
MPPDLYLLAHSHGIALLDALTDWRARLKSGGAADPRYGEAYQGWWTEGAFPRTPFEAAAAGGPLKRVVAWVISAGARLGPLVIRVAGNAGKTTLEASREYDEVLRAWRGTTPVVSMLHGNEHARTALNLWPPYDFLEPAQPALEPGVPLVDEAFIDAQVDDWVAAVYFPLAMLKGLAPNPLAHVLPPPPRERPEAAKHFEKLQEDVARYGFAPERLRLKWYRRYCRRLAERLRAIGCAVLEPPAQACSERGLLKEEFAEGLSHGNRAYGALTAARIQDWLRSARA